MTNSNEHLLKLIYQHFISLIEPKKDSKFESFFEEQNLFKQQKQYETLIEKTLKKKFFHRKELNQFIDNINNLLIKYAQHNYNNTIELTGDDILDSLITSIDFLGEELNYSTVTTHYLMDIFNSIGDLLFVTDQKGYILYVSEKTCKTLHYKEEDIKNQNIQMIFDKEDTFESIIREKNLSKTYYFLTSSGEKIPVQLNISDFQRQENPVMGQVIIARDISLQLQYQREIEVQNDFIKKQNEELAEALKKAEESEKLKSAFLANMSHEIRTPLNGIMGFSEFIQRPNIAQDDYKKFGSIILGCGKQLLGIVNDILDISKIEAGLLTVISEPCMINSIFDNIYSIYYQKIQSENKDVELSVYKEFYDRESYIFTDELRLRQILSNLLDNAVKYTEKGFISFGYDIIDSNLRFFVKDTGIGIPKEKQELIFKPFHQAAESTTKLYGGTGLGLAIANGLVKLLGGEMFIESSEHNGSVFGFTLPYTKSLGSFSKKKDEFSKHIFNWSGKTILIVEDDEYSWKYLDLILQSTGAKLLFSQTGSDAITKSINEQLDVILLDIRLPDMDGISITKTIRSLSNKVPIIAQTAHASSEDKMKCIRAGCNYYISKPIDHVLLFATIDSIFHKQSS